MTWHIFDEGQRRGAAPAFQLPSSAGSSIGLSDYRGWRNVALFFPHAAETLQCQTALKTCADFWTEYGANEAEILAVLPAGMPTLVKLRDSLDLPFPLLSDAGLKVRQAYTALLPDECGEGGMAFVLDRYGAPYAAWAGTELDDRAIHEEIIDWLAFIELQCPE